MMIRSRFTSSYSNGGSSSTTNDSSSSSQLYSNSDYKRKFFYSIPVLVLLYFVLGIVLNNNTEYIVVIDAGSSGSRAHVFQHVNGVVDPKHVSLKTKPGLSSYASHPKDAGPALQPLVDFAKEHIPAERVASTKLILKGTAGLRLLTPAEREAVMDDVKKFLSSTDFLFSPEHDAQVIEGSEEGVLGWKAINYLNRSPGTWGVFEMGGASVQVSLPISASIANDVPKELKRPYQDPITGVKGEVFTHSFLGLGETNTREAVNKILEKSGGKDPCLQTGYTPPGEVSALSGLPKTAVPEGDFDKCLGLIVEAIYKPFEKTQCQHTGGCFFNGLYKPSLPSHGKLWAFENFFYVPSALGMKGVPGKITIGDLVTEGRKICAMDWKTMDASYPKDDQPRELNEKWCFGSAHIYSFLTQALGMTDSHEIMLSNNVGNNGIDWALGAAIQAVATNKKLRRQL